MRYVTQRLRIAVRFLTAMGSRAKRVSRKVLKENCIEEIALKKQSFAKDKPIIFTFNPEYLSEVARQVYQDIHSAKEIPKLNL